MASGAAGGGALLLLIVALRGSSGDFGEDIAPFVPWLGVTSLVMLAAGVLASLRAYGAVTFGATTAAERRVVPLLGIERLAVPSRPTTTVRTTTTGGR
jgi:hypothetical protein